jgi:hypothetical protein
VIRAAAFRQSGDQLRGELHRVEGEPAAFFRVNGKAAGLATVRTQNARANGSQVDFHSSLRKPKVNSIDSPGVVGAQKSGMFIESVSTPRVEGADAAETTVPCPEIPPITRVHASSYPKCTIAADAIC